jgi:hypothetical protein
MMRPAYARHDFLKTWIFGNFGVASPSVAEVIETRLFWSFCHRFAVSLSGRTSIYGSIWGVVRGYQ